jgi:Putative transposase
VLSRLFRRLFLEKLVAAHKAGHLKFFGDHAGLADLQAFATYLSPLRRAGWVVYAKRPFGGPQAVLAYLSRYTHRVAIANSRLIACDRTGVTFRWKDYRADGHDRQKVMTLSTGEFAGGTRTDSIAQARELLAVAKPEGQPTGAAVDPS